MPKSKSGLYKIVRTRSAAPAPAMARATAPATAPATAKRVHLLDPTDAWRQTGASWGRLLDRRSARAVEFQFRS